MGDVIVSGRAVACDAHVVGWSESGLQYGALGKRSETRFVVLHWTGGRSARGAFDTILSRHLSVHFVIAPDGTVFQHADADRRCAHAGSLDDSDHDGHQLSANATSVGIEIVNPASGPDYPLDLGRTLLRETIHGREVVYSSFTAAQVTAALRLVRTLCGAYGLPLAVPMIGSDVLATVMDEALFKSFRGVCGHFQLTRRKTDCGLALLRSVAALGNQPLRAPDLTSE